MASSQRRHEEARVWSTDTSLWILRWCGFYGWRLPVACVVMVAAVGASLALTAFASARAAVAGNGHSDLHVPRLTNAPQGKASVDRDSARSDPAREGRSRTSGSERTRCRSGESARCAELVARRLSRRLLQATTDRARYRATLDTLESLRLPIVTSAGRLLSRGAEDAPKGFNIYQFEVRVLANALKRRHKTTLDQLSSEFASYGLVRDGKPIPPSVLHEHLRAATAGNYTRGGYQASIGILLVEHLGRQHGGSFDVRRRDIASETVSLDPVQAFVLHLEVILAATRVRRTAAALFEAQPKPCDDDVSTTLGELMPAGKWAVTLFRWAGAPVRAAAITLDAIHGPLLAFSVSVKATTKQFQFTHYGPSRHVSNADKVLYFGVKVEMLDDLGASTVNCGRLAGVKFPRQGPVKGVPLTWDTAVLERHGTLHRSPSDGRTGPDGIAELIFDPKSENYAAAGLSKSEGGLVAGTALYQSAFANIPGSVAQLLFPKWAGMRFEVAFHDTPVLLQASWTGHSLREISFTGCSPVEVFSRDEEVWDYRDATPSAVQELGWGDQLEGWSKDTFSSWSRNTEPVVKTDYTFGRLGWSPILASFSRPVLTIIVRDSRWMDLSEGVVGTINIDSPSSVELPYKHESDSVRSEPCPHSGFGEYRIRESVSGTVRVNVVR
jgi:hypothetical protein